MKPLNQRIDIKNNFLFYRFLVVLVLFSILYNLHGSLIKKSVEFAQYMKQCLKDSRELQKSLETQYKKKNMKKFGDKKHFGVFGIVRIIVDF